jgi:hypothetical protein
MKFQRGSLLSDSGELRNGHFRSAELDYFATDLFIEHSHFIADDPTVAAKFSFGGHFLRTTCR